MVAKQILDFTNVKDGGNFSKKRMPSGDYLAKITKVEDSPAKDGTPMWLFTVQLQGTPSATYPYYCKLQENQLWKVRNMLVAAGLNVPKKRVSVDPTKLVNKLVAVSLDDAEYNDKEQSEIGSIFSPRDLDASVEDTDDAEEEDEDDAEEETPPPAKKKKAKPAPEPEPEEEDDEEEDEEPVPAPKKKKKAAPAPEPEEDEEDEDEEEDTPPPAPKKKKAKPPVDEDEDEIEIEDLD